MWSVYVSSFVMSGIFGHLSYYFFLFKQKTAYEMRSSDWSSDVCSSDLRMVSVLDALTVATSFGNRYHSSITALAKAWRDDRLQLAQIGRASCRERVCQYV